MNMATYKYKCADCDNKFAIKASIREKEEVELKARMCPKCHSKNTKQEFSMVHFVKNIFRDGEESDGCCRPKSGDKGCC